MDMNTILAMMGRQPGMQQPPGAYGQPQYAPNAGIDATPRGGGMYQQPGLLEQLRGMVTPDFTPSPEKLAAQEKEVARMIAEKKKQEMLRRKMMEQHIQQAMQQQGGAPVADAPMMPPADQRLGGLGAARDMQIWKMLQQAGVEKGNERKRGSDR